MSGLCKCGHLVALHQVEGLAPQCTSSGCVCLRFRVSEQQPTSRSCIVCSESKPIDDFYGRNTKCKDCDNARPRERSLSKIVRGRGRHRAVAELIRRHEGEFRVLLDQCTAEAEREAAELASHELAVAASPAPLRLKPGQRRAGQSPTDRIDVARCSECIGHHDRGHICSNCGSAPHAARDTG